MVEWVKIPTGFETGTWAAGAGVGMKLAGDEATGGATDEGAAEVRRCCEGGTDEVGTKGAIDG